MTRLNNAIAQRNAAREEALMVEAKLKQLQEEVESGRLRPEPVGDGHLTPQSAGSEEGVFDRVRRMMQTIPSTSPAKDSNGPMTPMTTPSGAALI